MTDQAPRFPKDRRQASRLTDNERRSGLDRRRRTRIPLGLDFAVPVVVRMGTRVEQGLARNISEGGMLVELDQVLPIGRRIEISFVRGSKDVTLTGEVRHQVAWQHSGGPNRRTMYGIGVRFVEAKHEELPLTSWVWNTGTALH